MRIWRQVAGAIAATVGSLPVQAQTVPSTAPENIGAVEGSAALPSDALSTAAPTAPVTANQFAPSHAPLSAIQPTSVIGAETLKKIITPTFDYNDALTLTPGATDIAPAGPGLQQDFGQSIRGLQYTEFSVLFDGIPVPGFPINLSPQTGTYFLGRDFSSITVNRGPGQASAIGNATFGGWIDLASQNLLSRPELETYGTFGSFGTKFFGIEGQSGEITSTGATRVALDLTREEARGALSGIATERRNLFFKLQQPIGANTVVTIFANTDNDDTKTPYGTSLRNIVQFGRDYSLNSDPTSQTFSDYNTDKYTTDFEYLGVHSFLGDGWTIDNKAFTTAYYQRDRHGLDVGGIMPNLSGLIFVNGQAQNVTNDVPGVTGQNNFRDWGDVLRLSKAFRFGELRFGIWGDRQGYNAFTYNADFTRNAQSYTTAPGATPFTSQYFASLVTIQPYGEFAYRVTSNLILTAGVKYSAVTRALNGPVTFTGAPADDHASYNKALPSFDAHWRARKDLTLFAQAARGYLTPPLNLFSSTLPVEVQPSTTWSYQIGTVYQRSWLSLAADAYYIDFSNNISSVTVGGFPTYANGGGAVFKGLEFEGTVRLGAGFAVYANGTLNDSSYNSNGNNLQQTPRRTAAVALLYDKASVLRDDDDLYANITGKLVGPQYAVDTPVPGQFDQFPIKTWEQFDLNLGYVLPAFGRRFRAGVNVTNLFDNRSLTGILQEDLEGDPLYAVHAGRGIFFSFSAYL